MSYGGADGRRMVEFPIWESTVLKILKGDITEWSVDGSSDAIVSISVFSPFFDYFFMLRNEICT